MGWIWNVVSEAQVAVEAAGHQHGVSSAAELQGQLSRTALRYLALGIVEIQAKMLSKCNSAWTLVSVVGQSMGVSMGDYFEKGSRTLGDN